ncbi:uncharacterized protein BT62DRAFT_1003483 [Guyanagaster necrorhizus]|uniref:Uncharacterized protein n=1 Tax=Guyanagaster necrorhizus TaxID=856835 RepID=A0A9P7VYG2_9AGAR|nr:uncharacterized protein BT62DRAFT_1003483 [Guyanagaster necrorhizus MCA 3950]KAG7448770.1 hypothetical protein BT62DRAFT_1003483 [Guyanagaster necrorhizus MCA 3950]
MLSLNVTPPTLSYEGLDRVLAFQAYLSPSVTRKRTRHTLPTSFVSAVQWNESHQRIVVSWSNHIPSDPLEQELMHPMHRIIERVQNAVSTPTDGRRTISSDILDAYEYVENLAFHRIISLLSSLFLLCPSLRPLDDDKPNEASLDIERGAKLGFSLGVFYRVVMEGGSVPRHKLCEYKIKAAWKTHKKVCGKLGQREQALPVYIIDLAPSSGSLIWFSRRKVSLDKFTWERFAERLETQTAPIAMLREDMQPMDEQSRRQLWDTIKRVERGLQLSLG